MPPLLALRGLAKSFPGVRALKPLDLDVEAGELLGLVGENGAGKSTLIKLLSGVLRADAGDMIWRGESLRFASPRAAIDAGIATIHQELAYFARLSVAENLLMGESWPRHRWGGVDWPEFYREADRRLRRFGVDVAPRAPFESLSAADKQEVAIARALWRKSRLLILDEPTASLSPPEAERLFGNLRKLSADGVAILYISHRLEEVIELSSRVVVLRDGQLVATHRTGKVDAARLVTDMVGRSVELVGERSRRRQPGGSVLEVRGLTRRGMFDDVSFTLHAGEIVGLAGLVGAGRSELARSLYGLYPADRGEIRLRGERWTPRSPATALRDGVVYVPEERKRQALVLEHGVAESVGVGFLDQIARWGVIGRSSERARIDDALPDGVLRAGELRSVALARQVGTLSGGNQQKTVLARWLSRAPSVLVLDEPTRGVDVAAKEEIHALIEHLAAEGKAVLLISSELGEILGLSDRILVMREGCLVAELRDEKATRENVLLAASGVDPAETGCS